MMRWRGWVWAMPGRGWRMNDSHWLKCDPGLARVILDSNRNPKISEDVARQLDILEGEIQAAYNLLAGLLGVNTLDFDRPSNDHKIFLGMIDGSLRHRWRALSSIVQGLTVAADPDLEYILILRNIPYWIYLKSNHWQDVRSRTGKRFDYRCALCGANDKEMHTHHNNYRRIGFESDADLIRLCKDCHAAHHARWDVDNG